ncbi:MucB/RseB C-terminal domain-containing protein [Celerinatantimonas sp. MCCC 1A17872]|uniref:MucB/RseB C-terminal domain-containing protein n=1 Tax=Celerinatantimonas sp. MCCC 1A17872 TaxID=3177514 RepID=UPI0038BE85E6
MHYRIFFVCLFALLSRQVIASPSVGETSSSELSSPEHSIHSTQPSTGASSASDKISPDTLLSQFQKSYHHDNYELSYIRVRQGSIEPMRLFHGVINGVEVVHRIHLNGPVRESVRRGDQVAHYAFGQTPYSVKASRMAGMMDTLGDVSPTHLMANYDLVVSGKGRVAGRVAQVIRIIPKHDRLYGLYLWLDEVSHLPLRIDIVDRHGNLVEQQMALDLALFDKPTQWMEKLSSIDLPALSDLDSPKPSDVKWQLGWKPTGMQIVSQDQHVLAITQQRVDYLKLSDGLFDVSVYAYPKGNSQILQGEIVRQGATSLHSVVHNGMEITVVGEVPPQTATLIAQSVKLIPAKAEDKAQEISHD